MKKHLKSEPIILYVIFEKQKCFEAFYKDFKLWYIHKLRFEKM